MKVELIADKVLARIESQKTPFFADMGIVGIFNEHVLPPMMKVEETGTWNVSGSGQWGPSELPLFTDYPSEVIGVSLAHADAWILMVGISEILMHGEEQKAREVALTAITCNVNSEEKVSEEMRYDSLLFYFGKEITGDLLSSPVVK